MSYDFGYTWVWTHGHLLLAAVFAAVAWLIRRRVALWITAVVAGLALWAFAGFLIVQFPFAYNSPLELPVRGFLDREGPLKILDVGCGSGRATVMAALARPKAHVVGLDNFSADYIADNGEARLRDNLRVAGIADSRVTVVKSDMRKMPFPDGEFDGIVSTYAIDHLNQAGIELALAEVSRVLKPGGEFLLLVIRSDAWLKTVYGPMLLHQRKSDSEFWPRHLQKAGLSLTERGTRPGTAFYVAQKR